MLRILLPLLTAGVLLAPAADAAMRIDGPATVAAGTTITVRGATAKTSFWLSRDARRSKGDLRLGRGKRRASVAILTVPASAKTGAYRLLACRAARCAPVKGSVKVTPAGTARKARPGGASPTGGATANAIGGGASGAAGAMGGTGGDTTGGNGNGTGTGSGGTTDGDATPGAPPGFDAPAAPRSITRTLDSARAESATVGTAGGQLVAQGAGGTTFTLTIPADALAGDQEITLTPVAGVDKLPFSGGLGAAVEIAPDGLALLRPATLEIDDPSPVALSTRTGFGWHGTGGNLHLEPTGTDPEADVLRLWHFSGYGTASATAADRAAQQQAVPVYADDRLRQQQAELEDAVKRGGGEITSDFIDREIAMFLAFYDKRVKPLMSAAKTDAHLATGAIRNGLGLAREIELRNYQDTVPALAAVESEIMLGLEPIVRNAVAEAYASCLEGEPAYVTKLLGLHRTAALMGFDGGEDWTRLDSCARFELDSDGSYSEELLYGMATARWTTEALPLRLTSVGTLRLSGQKQVTNARWSIAPGPYECPPATAGTSTGEPFVVLDLGLRFNLFTELQGDREVDVILPPEIHSAVAPGRPTEHYTYDDVCDGSVSTYDAHIYAEGFYSSHEEAVDPQTGAVVLSGWKPGTDGAYATYASKRALDGFQEDLSLTLRHTPGG